MLINFSPTNFQYSNKNIYSPRTVKPNLAPLALDTVSFRGKENKQIKIDKIKAKLKDAIKNNDAKTIYKYFGIDAKEDKEGYLTISEYKQPSEYYSFKDLGINENKLFEKVKQIKGYANFYNSQITNLDNLKYIDGDAYFGPLQIADLGNLKYIGGDAYFRHSKIKSLGKLESIGGNAYFRHSEIKSLGNLETIGGNADFRDSKITSLENLETIGGDADFRDSKITSLENLETIEGNADFSDSQITNLGTWNNRRRC